MLHRSYEHKRLIISRHIDLLLNLPYVKKDSSEELCKLADRAQNHFKSLVNIGINFNTETIVRILEQRLPPSISYDWEKTLSKDEFLKFNTLIEFIYSAASRFSSRLNADISKHASSYPNKRMKFNNHDQRRKSKGTGKTFLTSTSEICTLCSESSHPLFRCKKFAEIPQLHNVFKL